MPRFFSTIKQIRRLAVGLLIFSFVAFFCSFFIQGNKNPEWHQTSKVLLTYTPKKKCNFSWDKITSDPAFPHCKSKIHWMQYGWQSDSCYASYGVDGSNCSFYEYLSVVENHCPPDLSSPNSKSSNLTVNFLNLSYQSLFDLMKDNPTNYQFIQSRISRLFNLWKNSLDDLIIKIPEIQTRKKLNIVIYMGFLSKETKLNFGAKAEKGGPLGELVQWSDLIASCYLLGHNLLIASEFTHFKSVTTENYRTSNACPQSPGKILDIIFTDIMGLRKMKQRLKPFYLANKCRIRLLDSFGTHAEFNHQKYFKEHWKELGSRRTNPWGNHELELQQFLTMYPHTDDNTFLGFVVETFQHDPKDTYRKNVTLVYGKEKYMWKDSEPIFEVAQKFTSIHGTIADSDEEFSNKFNFVTNHNLLTGKEFHALLRQTKIFLGLGFPLEGPAPLEAVANGAIFINHRFNPPKSRLSYKFFEDKPTLRELDSQSPYMERFIGEPYVITCNVFNQSELEAAYQKAMSFYPEPFLPIEFSAYGMLERVDVILSRHNFCEGDKIFPPFNSSKIILGESGESCQDACGKQGYVCERSFFPKINIKEIISKFADCGKFEEAAIPSAPSQCVLQSDPLLYSCASHPPSDIQRICPCRTFKKGQIVLP
uniref:Alpha-1,6-mannosyl-glycoprotein 6-beta-N-acetylglucosaminyltransferase n=1 Tax=Panagrolaimus sp. PS1159 TaxID=55785 RepID=A0AC35F5V5_9BILA